MRELEYHLTSSACSSAEWQRDVAAARLAVAVGLHERIQAGNVLHGELAHARVMRHACDHLNQRQVTTSNVTLLVGITVIKRPDMN